MMPARTDQLDLPLEHFQVVGLSLAVLEVPGGGGRQGAPQLLSFDMEMVS